ncbi:MAG: recombinase family protein [Oscillospiraceae bacterium]
MRQCCDIRKDSSSDKQTENSIEAQVRACEDYAEIHGYTINKIYSDEAVSAKNDRRPEFQKMIKDAEKGLFQTVLVLSITASPGGD